jgi:plastocyanin
MKKILILLLTAALLLMTCGCTETAPEPLQTPVPTTKAPSPTYLPATTMPTPEKTPSVNDNYIVIRKDGFSPATITIGKGASVRWVNSDSTDDPAIYNPTHAIQFADKRFSKFLLSPGQSFSQKFDNIGTYAYADAIHQDLKGTVIVE